MWMMLPFIIKDRWGFSAFWAAGIWNLLFKWQLKERRQHWLDLLSLVKEVPCTSSTLLLPSLPKFVFLIFLKNNILFVRHRERSVICQFTKQMPAELSLGWNWEVEFQFSEVSGRKTITCYISMSALAGSWIWELNQDLNIQWGTHTS